MSEAEYAGLMARRQREIKALAVIFAAPEAAKKLSRSRSELEIEFESQLRLAGVFCQSECHRRRIMNPLPPKNGPSLYPLLRCNFSPFKRPNLWSEGHLKGEKFSVKGKNGNLRGGTVFWYWWVHFKSVVTEISIRVDITPAAVQRPDFTKLMHGLFN
jgi:hypothetical protein